MNEPIKLEQVSKSYGSTEALSDFTVEFQNNRVTGLLGLNGAGKTTTLKLLTGLLKPDAGSIRVFGEDPWEMISEQRRRIGFLSEDEFPFEDMAFEEAAQFTSRFYPSWDADYLNDLVDLLEIPTGDAYRNLSKGVKRKFYLALTLAPKPDVLLLDDPAQGLDVTVRRKFIESIMPLLEEQESTVLFSSHIMSDVERLADAIAIIKDGRLLLHRSMDQLKEQFREVVVTGTDVQVPDEAFCTERRDRSVSYIVEDPDDEQLEAYREQGGTVQTRALSLEDLFVELVETSTGDQPLT